MSNYDPKRMVEDFVDRTWANYDFIKENYWRDQSSRRVYNVTQLVNSLLGLLIFPQQEFYRQIPAIPIAEMEENGWPHPNLLMGEESTRDLQALLRRFRNGIAHFRVTFLANAENDIVGMIVSDAQPGREVDWQFRMSIMQLEQFLRNFTELIKLQSNVIAREMVELTELAE